MPSPLASCLNASPIKAIPRRTRSPAQSRIGRKETVHQRHQAAFKRLLPSAQTALHQAAQYLGFDLTRMTPLQQQRLMRAAFAKLQHNPRQQDRGAPWRVAAASFVSQTIQCNPNPAESPFTVQARRASADERA